MTNTWLTPEEVARMTRRQRRGAQCRKLAKMGIPFKLDGEGDPLVERSAVLSSQAEPRRKRVRPNWDAMRGKAKAA